MTWRPRQRQDRGRGRCTRESKTCAEPQPFSLTFVLMGISFVLLGLRTLFPERRTDLQVGKNILPGTRSPCWSPSFPVRGCTAGAGGGGRSCGDGGIPEGCQEEVLPGEWRPLLFTSCSGNSSFPGLSEPIFLCSLPCCFSHCFLRCFLTFLP